MCNVPLEGKVCFVKKETFPMALKIKAAFLKQCFILCVGLIRK